MEFIRECGSFQGDLARRAGRLLRQYAQLSEPLPDEDKLDATPSVAILSLLLVNCSEALAVMEKDDHAHLLWRDVRKIVVDQATSTFPIPIERTSEADALSHLRNAVSHPLATRQDALRLTGYTSRPADADLGRSISRLEFISSPWVNDRGVLPQFQSRSEAKVKSSLGRFAQKYHCGGELKVSAGRDGMFSVVSVATGMIYSPEFSVLLELAQMESLALSVANFLAHVTHDEWDGGALEDLLTG